MVKAAVQVAVVVTPGLSAPELLVPVAPQIITAVVVLDHHLLTQVAAGAGAGARVVAQAT
jgi:hypothetical protein